MICLAMHSYILLAARNIVDAKLVFYRKCITENGRPAGSLDICIPARPVIQKPDQPADICPRPT